MANLLVAGNSTNGGTAISTDTSGTLNIVTGSGSGANAITIDASQAVTMPGNLTVSGTLTASGGVSGGIRSGTAVASTSGTSIDFTSLPTGVKRITVMVTALSTNGSAVPQIQIGSGSVTTSGYITYAIAAGLTGAITSGFPLNTSGNGGSGVLIYGSATLVLLNSATNTWAYSACLGVNAGGNTVLTGGGSVALSGVLDRVRFTTTNGTDTFDSGSINILYE